VPDRAVTAPFTSRVTAGRAVPTQYRYQCYLEATQHIAHRTTGRYIMYSGITKIYYRKTVRHVFTKPVQIEGKIQSPLQSTLFFIVVHISAARRCECV